MGKRSGVTKSGRVMNPADRERKQLRLKELKRNKKQRVQVRNAIVKNRNPDELIEQMQRLDDQEFDPQRELSLNVLAEKRTKLRGAYIQIIALHRQEKEDKKVKNLERLLHEYELERFKKEQNFKAKQFSESADPDEIPLPSGSMAPDAAKTPYTAMPLPPVPPLFQSAKAGILKKSTAIGPSIPAKKHKYPPGPPCGLPPRLTDSDEELDEDVDDSRTRRSRRVRFNDADQELDDEDDYAPVEIPETMLGAVETEPQQPVYMRGAGPPPFSAVAGPGGRILPPGMVPHPQQHSAGPTGGYYPPGFQIPPNVPPEVHAQYLRNQRMHASSGQGQGPQPPTSSTTGLIGEPHPSAVISAGPQVVLPSVDKPATGPVITAEPQMRNLKRETTRFVPSALRVQRPQPTAIGPKIPAGPQTVVHKPKAQPVKPSAAKKTVDDACDEFLRELEGLL